MQSSIPLTTGNSADPKRSAYHILVIWLDTWRSWCEIVYSVATPFPSPCAHEQLQSTTLRYSRVPARMNRSIRAGAKEAQVRYAIFDEDHISYSYLLYFVPESAIVHRSSFILVRRDLLTIHVSHSHTASSMDYSFMKLSCSSRCHNTGSRWSQDDDDYNTSSSYPGCD